ncbi:trichohyalin [Periophthalmus magnuspinnatus]|uniref:trichohyalin n=1 Tax=Periophthalmus magnuspinnatus TaxID=409849 RepID=UPI0024370011|nr:trichohyalin [Periophthalmus magnuspinnatus]
MATLSQFLSPSLPLSQFLSQSQPLPQSLVIHCSVYLHSSRMSLRAKSHSDLPSLGKSLEDPLLSSLSLSSSSMNKTRHGPSTGPNPGHNGSNVRRPVRAVRPISATAPTGSFLQVNHLQGELVRKRKECEDLKRENKYLSNEIHMERIMMRNENELTMRNLRNLNQDLQNQLKELKQKLQQSQQRAALNSRAAEEAESARGGAETARAAAEARALGSERERQISEEERQQLRDQLMQLKSEHKELQLLQAQMEKDFFETKLKLDRVSGEKHALIQENRSLEQEREELRQRLRQSTEEYRQLQESEQNSRRRAVMSEEESQKANQAQREADAERRLAEKDRHERVSECLQWKERFQDLSLRIRAEEELRALRQNKACQANIQSFFLCMSESDQRVKILRNPDGTPKNFTEGDPVYISTEASPDDPERSSSRSMVRAVAPGSGGPVHFDECPPFSSDRPGPDSAPASRRHGRRNVEYFWIPTNQE